MLCDAIKASAKHTVYANAELSTPPCIRKEHNFLLALQDFYYYTPCAIGLSTESKQFFEKNQKIYKNGHKNACIYEKDMIYYVSIK
jgi:hypothetical protein